MARRQRIDTVAGAAATVAKAKQSLEPPAHVKLDKADRPFFDSVVAECARSEWTGHTLELAAILARSMADLYREQSAMREEGSVITIAGKPSENPRAKLAAKLAATILSMRRSLALHARGQGGDARDIGRRRELARQIEDEASDNGSDLLA